MTFKDRQLNSMTFQTLKIKFFKSMTFQIFQDLYEPCNSIKMKIKHLEKLFGYLGAPKVTFVSSTPHFVGCKMDKHIHPQM